MKTALLPPTESDSLLAARDRATREPHEVIAPVSTRCEIRWERCVDSLTIGPSLAC